MAATTRRSVLSLDTQILLATGSARRAIRNWPRRHRASMLELKSYDVFSPTSGRTSLVDRLVAVGFGPQLRPGRGKRSVGPLGTPRPTPCSRQLAARPVRASVARSVSLVGDRP